MQQTQDVNTLANPNAPPKTRRGLRVGPSLLWLLIAGLSGYLSAHVTRGPIWTIKIPEGSIIAGISEARREIVYLSQFDQSGRPIPVSRIISEIMPNDPNENQRDKYWDLFTSRYINPGNAIITVVDLATGQTKRTYSFPLNCVIKKIIFDAERFVLLDCGWGNVVEIDRIQGTVTSQYRFSIPGRMDSNGTYVAYLSEDTDGYFELNIRRHGESKVLVRCHAFQACWSPDGSKVALVWHKPSPACLASPIPAEGETLIGIKVFDLSSGEVIAQRGLQRDDVGSFFGSREELAWLDNEHLVFPKENRAETLDQDANGNDFKKRVPTQYETVRISSGRLITVSPRLVVDRNSDERKWEKRQLADESWYVVSDLSHGLKKVVGELAGRCSFASLQSWMDSFEQGKTVERWRDDNSNDRPVRIRLPDGKLHLSEQNSFLLSHVPLRQSIAVYDFRMPNYPTWLFCVCVGIVTLFGLFGIQFSADWVLHQAQKRNWSLVRTRDQ